MHSLDVGDTHGEVIGVANGLYGKLSDQIELRVVQIVHHLGYRHVLLFCRYEEVDFTEMVTIHNVNIYNILFEWQDKGWVSTGLKVDLHNLISFIVDVLIHWDENLVQKWENPGNKVVVVVYAAHKHKNLKHFN